MHVDDLIIGSGLAGLGVMLGLAQSRRSVGVLVDERSVIRHYPETQTPAQHLGHGGLGEYWHGVIPLNLRYRPKHFDEAAWENLLDRFYPDAPLRTRKGLFVPKAPIRAADQFDMLLARQDATRVDGHAIGIAANANSTVVTLEDGRTIEAGRCWLAAGAIGTAKLLMASGLIARIPRAVSDHVIGYAGHVQRSAETKFYFEDFARISGGTVMPSRFDESGNFLFTLRPARFDFAARDSGIAKRAVFGQPARRAVVGVARSLSPGLVSEALFNKFGLFRSSRQYSVYFQSAIKVALMLDVDGQLTRPKGFGVEPTVERGIRQCPFPNLDPTRLTDLFIPGIHLHGTISAEEERQFDDGSPNAAIQLVDAATLRAIGPEHHSFAMMARAFAMAESTL
jgi:hypothetical protein